MRTISCSRGVSDFFSRPTDAKGTVRVDEPRRLLVGIFEDDVMWGTHRGGLWRPGRDLAVLQRRIVWRCALLDQRAKGAAVLGKHADHKAQSVVLEREHAVDHVDAVFGPAVRALGPVRPMH